MAQVAQVVQETVQAQMGQWQVRVQVVPLRGEQEPLQRGHAAGAVTIEALQLEGEDARKTVAACLTETLDRVAVGCADNTVHVFETATGKDLATCQKQYLYR